MATELNAPLGLVPIMNTNGNFPKVTRYTVRTNITIYKHMPVCMDSTVVQIEPATKARIEAAGLMGVAMEYKAATTNTDTTNPVRQILVCDDPNALYELQSDAILTNAASYIKKVYGASNLAAGNTTTLNSKAQISVSSGTTTVAATASDLTPFLEVLRPVRTINSTSALTYSRYICRIIPPYHHYGMSADGLAAASVWKPIS